MIVLLLSLSAPTCDNGLACAVTPNHLRPPSTEVAHPSSLLHPDRGNGRLGGPGRRRLFTPAPPPHAAQHGVRHRRGLLSRVLLLPRVRAERDRPADPVPPETFARPGQTKTAWEGESAEDYDPSSMLEVRIDRLLAMGAATRGAGQDFRRERATAVHGEVYLFGVGPSGGQSFSAPRLGVSDRDLGELLASSFD